MIKNKIGFTIIEMLIYMGLLGLFLPVLSQIFISSLDLHVEAVSSASVEQDSGFILSRIQYDARRATSITTPAAPGNTSASLVLVINGSNHTYAISGDNLVVTSPAGTQVLNSTQTKVTSFSVSRVGNSTPTDTVRISVDLESIQTPLSGPVQSRSLQTSVSIR